LIVLDWRSPAEWKRIFRYYQAGILNTLFGYGAYALLLTCGVSMYVAQIISTVLGAMFNYVTYSRYAFSGHAASKFRFFMSYGVNYLMSLAILFLVSKFVTSPYGAGLVTVVIVSGFNYLILRNLVFRGGKA
jgi:putative flippase GtrA